MKTISPAKLFLIICITFFCSRAFAQGPADPGNDPIISPGEVNENINLPLKKSDDKNEKEQVYILQNISVMMPEQALAPKIYFSDFSKKRDQSFKTKISFSNVEEHERKLKLIFPIVSFTFHQI
jgi:hypothetical protein